MKRRKQETVTTYISTLTVNFGNNQPTKSKSNKITSESHNTAPKQHHVYSSTIHNSDAPQPYRQAQRSSGTYYQLTESSVANSNKEPPEPYQEASKNISFRTASKQRPAYSSTYEFPSKILQGSSSGLEHQPYAAVSQRAIHKFNPQQWRSSNLLNVSTGEKERAKAERLRDELKSSLPNSNKELPEPHQEVYENTSFRRSKTNFEELSSGRAGSSGSNSFTQHDQNQKSIDSLKTQSPSSSSTSITKKSTGSTAVSKEITTTITTTTTEEKKTLSGVKTEVKSTKPTTDYGETDWYLDLLLRMQALEMKQENLQAQYDFLGKLTNENKEDLKQARDWARYDVDNYQVEAY